ncbi:MAG: prolyl oligopeptidase family serine peptidase [Gammaproteobacteria bacterium]|nr:prolyl oligopeptidase family serine peptidase [Gammaproteobacteria bacterium]MDP2140225.1 prolyl oligopeptidase family serine peptidase [Gammaproteobacteria bacterium]MDP2348101.1 prolyl oligopeptidase family serine peptidase [Gammaproteobacteria bacterium]
MSKTLVPAAALCLIFLLSGCERAGQPLSYPSAPPLSHTDTLHGISLHDPYRWLEADAAVSIDVSDWLAAQQVLSTNYFAAVPSRTVFRDSLARLWQFERREAPRRFGGRWFFFRNIDSADHYELAVQDGLAEDPVTLLDPTQWSDPQRMLAAVSISPDGRFLVWLQTDMQGERRWLLRDLEPDVAKDDVVLDWLDVDDIFWRSDSQGFYYSAEMSQSAGQVDTRTGVFFHAVLQQQADASADEIIHASSNIVRVLAAVDERWLLMAEEIAPFMERIVLRDLQQLDTVPAVLGDGPSDALWFAGARDGNLFLLSTQEDPTGSVMSVDLSADSANLTTVVIAADQRQIMRVLPLRSGLLVEYLEAGVSVLEFVTMEGARSSLALPGLGRIASLAMGEHDDEILYSFSTLTNPNVVYRQHSITGASSILFAPDLSFAPDDFVVERLDVPLSETASIPVYVAGQRGRLRAPDTILLLEVYGGFGIPMDTGFSIARLGWMAQGGVYAMAAVRGGGELGPQWHEQARGVDKYRSIDDLLLVGEHLQQQGYVENRRLAVMGASHGAMLAAAAMNRNPALFTAAVLSAGPMDMLRLAELGGAVSWQEEYGSLADPLQFAALLSYSPFHNVRSGAVYPATLLLTSEDDEVVAPAHTYKFTARLQAEVDSARPVLLRVHQRVQQGIKSGGGHLDTGTVDELIDQYAQRWSFLVHTLGR